MCGILCYTENDHAAQPFSSCRLNDGSSPPPPSLFPPPVQDLSLPATRALLAHRGPDAQNELVLACPHQPSVVCHFYATLLWLRGVQPVIQPLTDESHTAPPKHVLLWNGDVFGGSPLIQSHQNDTRVILDTLKTTDGNAVEDDRVPDVFAQIQGPFAFVYWRVDAGKIWFGRDPLGRQSLLIGQDPRRLVLSSVVDSNELAMNELPALGIYELDLALLGQPGSIQIHAWRERVNIDHLDSRFIRSDRTLRSSVLWESALTPELTSPYVLSDLDPSSSSTWCHVLEEYLRLYQTRYVDALKSLLTESIRIRAQAQPAHCRKCLLQSDPRPKKVCSCSRVGVLFSGGLDSVVITALLCQTLPLEQSIDLMNVAFQKRDAQGQSDFLVPDRLTGIQAWQELKELYPSRRFNFVPIDVTKDELITMREKRVKKLLYPLESVLDDSIGCALWFAARGSTSARVLLLGMGADEQFGGYSRHRVRYQREGYSGLRDEIEMELLRISERNLGRDNRILSDHGIAARMPFLDENLVNFLTASVPISVRTRLELPRGLGDKILLRALAWDLGLHKTALEPKRAIQFGSRIAKLENSKEKGSDKAQRVA